MGVADHPIDFDCYSCKYFSLDLARDTDTEILLVNHVSTVRLTSIHLLQIKAFPFVDGKTHCALNHGTYQLRH